MYTNLSEQKITEKIALLQTRITERFPSSGLSQVCGELHHVSLETEDKCLTIAKPNYLLRIIVVVIIFLLLVIVSEGFYGITIEEEISSFGNLVSVIEAGLNAVVLIGAAILFLITVEVRIKRGKVLKSMDDLRSLAHVIDMHQLTKDPGKLLPDIHETEHSPKHDLTAFELTRYLDYCSEMLSLVGKVAAVYSQSLNDAVVLTAVNEIEGLTTGLSRKIWQKIMVINLYEQKQAS